MAVTCDICNTEIPTYHIKNWSYPVSVKNIALDEMCSYDAIDCPKCGCQKLLKRRYPKNIGGKK